MSVVTLQVDGRDVAVPAGATLLQAIRAAGLSVPTLCHLDGLDPVGACRLCLVELQGSQRLLPACASEAMEGQVIRTDTAQLRQFRRMAVELFFAEGNHVCAFCVANGNCELQDVAVAVGQKVQAGERVAVIEAMKMENVLFAAADGVVKKVVASKGESLTVDQMIVEFE